MSPTDVDPSDNSGDISTGEITKWDPGLTERVMGLLRPLIKGWHRSEVRGLESFPPGGATNTMSS